MNTDILVTGNDNLSRIAQSAAFTGMGYQVIEAHTLSEALTFLRCGLLPQTIVINMKLSSAQVNTFIASVRSELGLEHATIILVVDASEDTARSADVVLPRPATPSDVLTALASHCAA